MYPLLPLFQFDETPGPHGVGLKVLDLHDHSRTYGKLTDRPLQTLLWYPATRSSNSSMTVADYWNLWSTEIDADKPRVPAKAREWFEGMRPTMQMPLWAVRDAVPAAGRFPLVIYAPSFSSVSWENADLCEYLASHGFVVLASPSLGTQSRNMTTDLEGLRTQARDISFLIGHADTLSNADVSRVAVAGFSWGGLANVFAAARDSRIQALVALDGSLRYWPGLVKQASEVRPEQMTIPLISFAKQEWTFEEQARYLTPEQMDGPNVLNAWKYGDLYDVHMQGMTHREFSSMFQRNEDVWKDFHDPQFPDRQKADYGRESGISGYGWVARYTLQFLSAYLKQDAPARAWLRKPPAQNGVPRHFMDVSFRAAETPPPLQDEKHLNDQAEELIDQGRLVEANALLDLNVSLHPDSSEAHANRARGRQLAGDIPAAIEGYSKALEGQRINPLASRKLRELGAARGRDDE